MTLRELATRMQELCEDTIPGARDAEMLVVSRDGRAFEIEEVVWDEETDRPMIMVRYLP